MHRCPIAALLILGLAISGAVPSLAQVKKGTPKKKERIAIADPKDAAKDPDFAIQGEYEGASLNKEQHYGAQVIAKGMGEFEVKIYKGGLPGAGWDGKSKPIRAVGTRTGDEPRIDPTLVGETAKMGILAPKAGTSEMVFACSIDKLPITMSKVQRKSKTLGKKPPEGAAVLFGKVGDEAKWTNGKLMELSDGTFLTVAGTRSIKSKQTFGAFAAHVEFRTPWMPNSTGQGRGNSGVYLQDRYECQVLDSFGLSGENNECGGIYTQHKPKVNMCYPPLSWQTYDIEFTPAVFEGDKKVKNARATIYHNGVKIHDDVEFPKECPGGQPEKPTPGPFQFQDHGDPVVYNNVWVVEKK